MTNKLLDVDIKKFLEIYPSFVYKKRTQKKYSILEGEIDICDVEGNYWDSYKVKILIDKGKYPYSYPIVSEVSEKIKRDPDWHISDDGTCCLDINHELEYASVKGIDIISFYQEKIYPFFANTVYKKACGIYANGEYKHNFDGVIQFYNEELKIKKIVSIVKILNSIINNDIPGRNKPCLCGSKIKIKYCHLNSILFLKSLSKETIIRDLKNFEKIKS